MGIGITAHDESRRISVCLNRFSVRRPRRRDWRPNVDTISTMGVPDRKALNIARAYLWSHLFWISLAFLAAGEDKGRIWARGLHTTYWTILLVNGAFLLSAALLTPPLFAIVHRHPISKPIRFGRMAGYVLGAAVYTVACVSLRW